MLVHSGAAYLPPQPSTTQAVTLEDLLDLEMFANPSSPSSRQSSPMPPSPQPGLSLPDAVSTTDSLWPSFFASASSTKELQMQHAALTTTTTSTPPPPLFPATGSSQSIADFLSALSASTADLGGGSGLGSGSNSIFTLPSMVSATSPATSSSASTTIQPTATSLPSITLSPSSFTIDPQLTTPQTPSFDDIDEEDSEDDDEQMIAPVKVGGKGKSQRKGTVAGGGVTKRTGGASAFKDSTHEPEDWRPSPEEYKKLSSKEKRQLRNKISARNFRVRRKEYISTLEGDIAERDRLISAIREELGTSRLENVELRREVEALKKAMLEGRTGDALPPPAPISGASGATSTATSGRTTRAALMPKVNTQKDVASSPRGNNTKSFWGGATNGGGVTSVHTTLVPDFSAASLAGKPASRNAYVPNYVQQENINPFLNTPAYLAAVKAAAETDAAKKKETGGSGLEGFADVNPFTLKTMDAYRMYLWTKMAREAGQAQRDRDLSNTSSSSSSSGSSQGSSPSPSSAGSPGSSGSSYGSLFTPASSPIISAANLKPSWLSSPTSSSSKSPSPSLAALLSGKSSPSSSKLPVGLSSQQQQTAQTAMLAAMASQTLASRMGGAFWDAFSGSTTNVAPVGNGLQKNWDAEKVRKVLEGKAVVRVVDVEDLGKLGGKSLTKSASTSALNVKKMSGGTVSLEESMKAMTLSEPTVKVEESCPKTFLKNLVSREQH